MPTDDAAQPSGQTSTQTPPLQTLSRGIRMLELLADAGEPLSIPVIASRLGLHRSITYRILRTLEDHGLVVRDAAGAVELGPRMATLARSVSRDLQSAALPQLTAVANELTMTAFLAVLDRHDVVTLVTVEPSHAHATVAQRPGTRHPLASGAPGIAIQSALTEAQWRALPGEHPRDDAALAQRRGYATSHDEVIAGLASIAVPVVAPGQPVAALAVVYVGNDVDAAAIGARLRTAAAAIESDLR